MNVDHLQELIRLLEEIGDNSASIRRLSAEDRMRLDRKSVV